MPRASWFGNALTATVDRLAAKVDLLATTVDCFIRAKGDGQNGQR